jgi:hypothetical protein
MAGLSLTLGLSQQVILATEEYLAPPLLSVSELPDGTVEISIDEGIVTITVISPAEYAGTYQVTTVELAEGPVSLVPPRIIGSGTSGETLTRIAPGLWVYSSAVPSLALQWLRNGDPIPGSMGESHLVGADDAGSSIALQETLGDVNGQRSSTSAPISIAPQTRFDVSFAGHGSTDYAIGRTALDVMGLPLGDEDASRTIVAAIGVLYGPANSLADIVGVTIAGTPATRLVASDPSNGPVEVWQAPVPDGVFGDVQVTTSQGCLTVAAAIYRVIDGHVRATRQAVSNGGLSVDLSVDTVPGSVVIACAKSANSGVLGLSGVIENHSGDIRTSDYFVSGHAEAMSAETPRQIAASAPTAGNIGGVAVVLESV